MRSSQCSASDVGVEAETLMLLEFVENVLELMMLDAEHHVRNTSG